MQCWCLRFCEFPSIVQHPAACTHLSACVVFLCLPRCGIDTCPQAEILELKKALAKAESRGRSQTAQLGMLSESLKDAVAQTDILKKRAALHVQKLTAALDAHSAACRNIEILTPQLLQRDSELLAAKERIRELEQRNAELRSKDLTKVKEALKEYVLGCQFPAAPQCMHARRVSDTSTR